MRKRKEGTHKVAKDMEKMNPGSEAEEESVTASEAATSNAEASETAEAAKPEAEEAEATAEEAAEENGEGEPAGEGPELTPRQAAKEIEKLRAETADFKDRYQRVFAEYDNFRKRTEKEKADIYAFAVRDVLQKMLPVLDNIERGLAQIPEEEKDDPIAQGMDKIHRQFEQCLSDVGAEPIEAVGKAFDPNFHNAVMHVDDDSVEDNTIVEELQRGYTYHGTVVRYAMVKVAN